ncbi:MAG: hypothetical protein HQM14_12555 [SAR324 cluster bacterium]|nr:hypothetical protein [SAR324 cluster bacterium]
MKLLSVFSVFLSSAFFFSCALLVSHASEIQEFDLGPIRIRNQFPISLRFLSMTPDTPVTLPEKTYSLSYQMSISNTFINTRGESGDLVPGKVKSGLEKSDFIIEEIQQPRNGFNMYVDVETYRHLFQVRCGLPFHAEIALEWPLLSFEGGFMDHPIEQVHEFTGVSNATEDGGFREKSDRNRFDYYLIRNNRFIVRERKPFSLQVGDPVFTVKWHLYQERPFIPHIGLQLSYKYPWDGADKYPRNLISSGRRDVGIYYLFAKSFFEKQWHLYLQGGKTLINRKEKAFKNFQSHLLFALEYHGTPDRSWLIQLAHQSSIFPSHSPPLANTYREFVVDRGLGEPTDVLILGVKQFIFPFIYSFGFAEDINQTRNEIDFLVFFEVERNFKI